MAMNGMPSSMPKSKIRTTIVGLRSDVRGHLGLLLELRRGLGARAVHELEAMRQSSVTCRATQTVPMPPSASLRSSRYRPATINPGSRPSSAPAVFRSIACILHGTPPPGRAVPHIGYSHGSVPSPQSDIPAARRSGCAHPSTARAGRRARRWEPFYLIAERRPPGLVMHRCARRPAPPRTRADLLTRGPRPRRAVRPRRGRHARRARAASHPASSSVEVLLADDAARGCFGSPGAAEVAPPPLRHAVTFSLRFSAHRPAPRFRRARNASRGARALAGLPLGREGAGAGRRAPARRWPRPPAPSRARARGRRPPTQLRIRA